ncbi:hypothetical protein EHM69_08280 [candidate division KSB1 bacterium]|nr:MAG: hypothetical protein EHM69_08280 [candidate division KSB1 bacterium]
MNNRFHRYCYNGLALPLLSVGARLLSLGNAKVKAGWEGRRGLPERVAAFRKGIGNKPVLLFHCASAGELEALKPISLEFDRSKIALAVSHFSPSAKTALQNCSEFDFSDYSPMDFQKDVRAYLDALRPSVIAITKHDVWPNLVWEAHRRSIPVFLINGNFHARSLKLLPGLRHFHSAVYSELSGIFAVSEEDANRARRIVGNRAPVLVLGDSRFDRVLRRMAQQNGLSDYLKNWCAGRRVIVAGSTHEDDEELILPVLARLSSRIPDVLAVVVPHDPSPKAKLRIIRRSHECGLSIVDLDDNPEPGTQGALLINRTGMLADLYRIGQIAYIGGGFGKGVHSVLEPMACGLPVLCGPRIHVSYEAREASGEGIVKLVRNRKETERLVLTWLTDSFVLKELRNKASDYVRKRGGVSSKIAALLMEALRG